MRNIFVHKADLNGYRSILVRVILLCTCIAYYSGVGAQSKGLDNPFYLSGELNLGKTIDANTNFPGTKIHKSALISVGWFHQNKVQEWTKNLKNPRTGITIGYADFGNTDKIGYALTLMPFLELSPFASRNHRWRLKTGLGLSYLNKQFDSVKNPYNRAVSTNIKFSFRSFIYYDLTKRKKTTWRLGLGLMHHSNGHLSLPNQGLNSVLAAIEAEIMSERAFEMLRTMPVDTTKSRTFQHYFSLRAGIGQNVLSEVFNNKKEVYSVAFSYGKIINSTFKLGVGVFSRVYEHYYDYIKNNEALVQEFYPHFADDPLSYSSNIGIMLDGELLLGYVGAEFNIGFNVIKPAYKIDWQLNQGYTYQSGSNTVTILGELDTYYELKRSIPTRLGLKWYFINTKKNPMHNLFIGAHINANFGQADFTELSFGYERRFRIKNIR